MYVMDLGQMFATNPKIAGTTHNVFGIQTGVAIGFFVRAKGKLGNCAIHYANRPDSELARDKLAYLRGTALDRILFDHISPDTKGTGLTIQQ